MLRYLIFVFIVSSSCKPGVEKESVKLFGEAQGTYYSVIYCDEQHRDVQIEIDSILDAFDKSVSLWVPKSILSRVNNGEENVVLDNYFIENFNLAQQVSDETDGAFDITIGSLVKAWGFGYDNNKNIDSIKIDSLLKLTGYKKVKLLNGKIVKENENITFDFNAIAQGYSVDLIGKFLESLDIKNYLIDIGGEVLAKGKKPNGTYWKVGIEKPAKSATDKRDLTGIIKLENMSIATSGNYRKFFNENGIKYSHIIDPKTGYPAQHNLLSASVVCNSTALADAYATAFMTMGLESSIKYVDSNSDIEAFFIFSDNSGNYNDYATDGFAKLIVREFNK
jgi:FAD:protein FMN transferase